MTTQPDTLSGPNPIGATITRLVMANNKNFPAIAASTLNLLTATVQVNRLDPIGYACRATIVGGAGDGGVVLALVSGPGDAFIADSLIDSRPSSAIPAGEQVDCDLDGWWNPIATGLQSVTFKLYRPGTSGGVFTVLGDFDYTETVGLFNVPFTTAPTVLELNVPN